MAVFLRRLSKRQREARDTEIYRLYKMGVRRDQISQQVSLTLSGVNVVIRKAIEKENSKL